jgi:HEAT repeat protein
VRLEEFARSTMSDFDFQPYLSAIVANQSQKSEDWRDGRYVETKAQLPLKVQTVKPQQSPEQAQKQEAPQRFDVLAGLREFYRREPVLLIGKPGSGKSTALRRLLLEEAQGYGVQDGALIPVLILLRSCKQGSVVDWIAEGLDVEVAEVRSMLRAKRLLLLFDGLNEVPNLDAYQALTQFLEKPSRVPMVFTTRELGADSSLGIGRKLEMLPLTEPQMREFIEMRLPGQGEQLIRQLGDKLRELAETPLLLNMLCQVLEQSGEIPQNRGELFRNKFVQDFDAIKHKGVVAADSGFFRFKNELLQHLAMKMIVGDGSPAGDVLQIEKTIAQGWLKDWLAAEQVSDAGEKARIWLEDLVEHHLLQVAGDVKQIEFHHQLFQEYYAAEWLLLRLKDLDDDALKQDYLNYLKWTEPLALMLGLVKDEALAMRVVEQALDVDLMLGARLAGEVNPVFHPTTIPLITQSGLPQIIEIVLLGLTSSDEVVSILGQSTISKNPDTRFFSIKALEKVRGKSATELLIKTLDNPEISLQNIAVEILGGRDGEVLVNALHKMILNRESPERNYDSMNGPFIDEIFCRTIVSSLGKIASQSAIDSLLYIVQGRYHGMVRSAAISKLGELNIKFPVNIFLQVIEDRNPVVGSKLLSCFQSMKNYLDLIAALQMQESKMEELRQKEGWSNGHPYYTIPSETFEDMYQNHLDSIAIQVKYLVDEFQNQDRSPLIDSLMRYLQDDDDESASNAVVALGELKEPSSVPTLKKVISSNKYLLWKDAVDALVCIGTQSALDAVIVCLEHISSDLRMSAVRALGKTMNDKFTVLIADVLHDEDDAEVRLQCVMALGKIGGQISINALLKQMIAEDYLLIQEAAARELGRLLTSKHIAQMWCFAISYKNSCSLEIIRGIQVNCKFYNYEIYQKAQTRHPPGEQQPTLATIDKTLNKIDKRTEKMEKEPKNDNSIHIGSGANVSGVVGQGNRQIQKTPDIPQKKSRFDWKFWLALIVAITGITASGVFNEEIRKFLKLETIPKTEQKVEQKSKAQP